MAEKTFNFNIIGTVDELKAYQSGTVVNTRILDGVTSLHPYIFYNMTSLQSVDFNQVEIIPADCCYGCSNLTEALFSTHTTEIGSYAFYNCTKFEDTELPHTLTNIGQYAFYRVGSSYSRGTHTFTMIDEEGIHTTIGTYGFCESHLSEIRAYTNNIGSRAFMNCLSLTDVNLEIHGSVDSYAFAGCMYVENFEINANSIITDLGDSAFSQLAYSTSPAVLNIAPFDFRNSTFTSLRANVWGATDYDGVVYFPSTLATISGNFLSGTIDSNWKLYFNSIPMVSSSTYLRDDTSNFTVKYFFPYDMLEQAAAATNWSSHTSQMIGYGTGFEAGTTLPQYARVSGVAITWYSDDTLTTQITTSSSATDVYYCVLGTTRIVWFVEQPQFVDASATISDGIKTYLIGDPVLVGTSVTVTPVYTDPSKDQLYLLKVNGTDYTASGTATVTMDQDLSIVALYWDGEHQPFLPTLADNDWDMIKLASKTGAVPASWNVGDTKTLTYDGTTFTARLVDKTGKFTRAADGSTAYLLFEFTEVLDTAEVYGTSSTNDPRSSPLLAKMNSGTIWNNLDTSLSNILETVNIRMSQGGGSSTRDTLIDFPAKLFLAREHDLFSTRVQSVQTEWNAIAAQDEYYQLHNTNADHQKRKRTGSAQFYWEMSPTPYGSADVCWVRQEGDAMSAYGINTAYVALRFAL